MAQLTVPSLILINWIPAHVIRNEENIHNSAAWAMI